MSDLVMQRSAIISPCGLYRYALHRRWQSGPLLGFLMVNPSTADAENDDATIRKCMGFAHRYGFAGIVVGNKFALRSTDVRALGSTSDPIGPDNDAWLADIVLSCPTLVAAWGPLARLPIGLRNRWRRVAEVARIRRRTLQCYGTCQDGQPRHPLMLPYAAQLKPWREPI